MSIRVPLHGPIKTVFADKKPDGIELEIVPTAPVPQSPTTKINTLAKTISYIFAPFFVSFYENNYHLALSKFGKNYFTWNSFWRMGWIVRNALSHNGCIFFKDLNTAPITWRGLTISPLDQNEPLESFLNFADIFFLLLDMNDDIS